MFKLFTSLFTMLLVLSLSYHLHSQENKRITIKYAGRGSTNAEDPSGAITFLRDNSQQVHFIHEGINMWCDKAIYYEKEDFIEAFSNVVMKQGDTINMTAKYVEYSGKTQLAYASGEVILKEPQSTLSTDTLYFDRTSQKAFYNTGGTVVKDTSGTITSTIGTYYLNQNKYQFVSNVRLVNPEYILNTNRLDFYTETGHAYLYGPSTIVGTNSKIYCERGFYDTKLDNGHFQKNARIDYNNRTVEGDSLYFDRNRSFASANNNITVTDTINNSIVKGHYAEVYRDRDSVFITKRALAITVQEKDSIYIHSDTLMVTGPPEKRITRGYYNVRIYKSDLAGKADSVHVNHETGLTKMINLSRFSDTDAFATARKPVLWNLGNQMTGDTIHLISNVKTEQLDSLKVFNNAFLVSKDTLSEDGYNQVKGQILIGLFRNNEMYSVDIIKNAEVIYYSRNAENELVGINKSKSGKINIQLSDNTIDEIRLIQQIDGDLYPESQFPKNGRLLRGFDWRGSERPQSVEDLFKDDPPLDLPVIQGIENAEPKEDFFDAELRSRVKSAAPKDTSIPNKAERNIPKDSSSIKIPKLITPPKPATNKAKGDKKKNQL